MQRRDLLKGVAGLTAGLLLPPTLQENAEAGRRFTIQLDRTMVPPAKGVIRGIEGSILSDAGWPLSVRMHQDVMRGYVSLDPDWAVLGEPAEGNHSHNWPGITDFEDEVSVRGYVTRGAVTSAEGNHSHTPWMRSQNEFARMVGAEIPFPVLEAYDQSLKAS